MASNAAVDRYVILPSTTLFNPESTTDSDLFLRKLTKRLLVESAKAPPSPAAREASVLSARVDVSDFDTSITGVTLVDAIGVGEAALVSMPEASRLTLEQSYPGLRVTPVVYAHPLWIRLDPSAVASSGRESGPKRKITVSVSDASTGRAIRNAPVAIMLDMKNGIGETSKTDRQGNATFNLATSIDEADAIIVNRVSGYWDACVPVSKFGRSRNLTFEIALRRLDIAYPDSRVLFNGQGNDEDGKDVVVGVIDGGVSTHRDLSIDGGRNLVAGEASDDYSDVLGGHGTHVAGIIAGRGEPGNGVRGIAPAVKLRAYRVYPKRVPRAANFAIAKAIRTAVTDGCHLINLSLGTEYEMPDVRREIQFARAHGVLCIAAAGNQYGSPVEYPAAEPNVLAVSAFGHKNGAPKETLSAWMLHKPSKTPYFMGRFSNRGKQIALIGPGVGIISTVPNGYAAADGTSMAAPAVTGAIAKRISADRTLLRMDPGQGRSDAFAKMALREAASLGLGPIHEGHGAIR